MVDDDFKTKGVDKIRNMKTMTGTVTSIKMNKTATVLVERLKLYPLYHKMIKRTKKYHVHDQIGVKPGWQVKIVSCKPISKTKSWRIIEGGAK